MIRLSSALFGIGFLLMARAGSDGKPGNPLDPVTNFEHVWNTLDRTYAQFEVKHVDWNALYRVYRPRITATTTERELWDTLLTMLRHLNDGHVCLSDSTRRVCAGLAEDLTRGEFSLDLVKAKYLHGRSTSTLSNTFTSGWLTEGIAYLHIADFKRGLVPTEQAIDAVMSDFASARAFVVDVRDNPGGEGKSADAVARRFADRIRNYMQVQTRYGPKHSDLGPVEYRSVKPGGPIQFKRPTILLTNRFSASAADGFVLAMRVLPHVTVVGDLTEGALSAQFPDRMPNGWTLWVAFRVARDHNGVCWDGVGVPPDMRIRNTPTDIAAGGDQVLEFAHELLKAGGPAAREDPGSLLNLKTSLVEEYALNVRERGLEAALTRLESARAAGDDCCYFTFDEAIQQSLQYVGRKQYHEAIGLLRAARLSFPRVVAIHTGLAEAYLGAGNVSAAEEALKEAKSLPAMFPMEPPLIQRAALGVSKRKFGSAGTMFAQALAAGGIPAAEKALQDLRARPTDGPVFDESDFNNLGYRLLKEKKIEEAVYVFQQTVRLYPDSWNAHDSLGEALMTAGETERAIESYRRSIELNPANTAARALLKRLEKGQ